MSHHYNRAGNEKHSAPDGIHFVEAFYRESDQGWSGLSKLEGIEVSKAEAFQPFAIDLIAGTKGK